MAVYTFINGVRKRVFSNKPCVYINGVKHHIGKCYTFINGTRKQIFDTWSFANWQLFTSNSSLTVPFGVYQIIVRGAGGAGGQSTGSRYGGAGGKGELKTYTLTFAGSTNIAINVGSGGLTKANGGNGGDAGDPTDATVNPGAGGGGGRPSFVTINNTVYGANGGGGGGGAGGSDGARGRYSDGASGGGGGGYYRLNSNGTTTSVPGKKGGKGTVYTS